MPVAVFLTEITAPTITPPDASVIVPEIVAPVTCECSGRDTIRQNPRIQAESTKLAFFGFMLVLLIQRCQCTSSISLPSLKNPNPENPWLRPRCVARKSLVATCLFEESDSGGKLESPQLYPDRVRNKRTDPVPDGIERAEPTLAPSRHRPTSELAKSRLHRI